MQHPREFRRKVATGRLAHLVLDGSILRVGESFEGDEELDAWLDPTSGPAHLLMPGPGSVEITTLAGPGPIRLLIPDGTWWEATRIVRRNPRIFDLPRTFVRPGRPSRFPLRRPPIEGLRSTAEAVVDALVALEGDPDRFRGLLGALDAFVAENERRAAGPDGRPRHRRRRGPGPAPETGAIGPRRRAWLDSLRHPSPGREDPTAL